MFLFLINNKYLIKQNRTYLNIYGPKMIFFTPDAGPIHEMTIKNIFVLIFLHQLEYFSFALYTHPLHCCEELCAYICYERK